MYRQRDARYLQDFLNPGGRVWMHSLGGGLILRVAKSGVGSWVQRMTVHGRRKDIGLDPTRTVSLKQAREWANLNKHRVLTGHPDAIVGISIPGPLLNVVPSVRSVGNRTCRAKAATARRVVTRGPRLSCPIAGRHRNLGRAPPTLPCYCPRRSQPPPIVRKGQH